MLRTNRLTRERITLYFSRLSAARIAIELGHEERARVLRDQAEELRRRFEETFWCDELGTYVLALDGEKRPCRVRSSNAGHALFAGIASPEHARGVADTLMSKSSFSGWGIRTLDACDKPAGLDWLEVGCGSGALTSAILANADPKTVQAIDPSVGFVDTTRQCVSDDRLSVRVGSSEDLEFSDSSADIVVSGLVLNFINDKDTALAEMLRVVRSPGTIAYYVWDYPGAGVEFMRYFWNAAVQCDPKAKEFTEAARFGYCNERDLLAIARKAGLVNLKSAPLEVLSVFSSFDDLWQPFTLGVGSAPGYCTNLPPAQRDELRQTLFSQLPIEADVSIHLNLRAWAISGDTE